MERLKITIGIQYLGEPYPYTKIVFIENKSIIKLNSLMELDLKIFRIISILYFYYSGGK